AKEAEDMTMTHRERILAAIRKQPTDCLPWGLRIDYWYKANAKAGTLPSKYQGWNMWDIIRDIGAGIQAHHGVIHREELRNLEVVTHQKGREKITEYITPIGTVSTTMVSTQRLEETDTRPYEKEKMFKRVEDYPVIEYMVENAAIVPAYDEFAKEDREVGNDGVVVGRMGASPMQRIMKDIMGFERFFYELNDNPDKVEHLFQVLLEQGRKIAKVAVESPAELIQSCSNFVDVIHTPPIFEKYFVPWFQEVAELFHANGKLLQTHIDGEMRRLLPVFSKTGIDVAEAFSPPPMTSCTATDLKKAWGDKITIWGGVATQLFADPYSDKDFDEYVISLFKEIAPGYNFIVGVGDNVPVAAKVDRLRRVTELIDKYGKLPMSF
ncbi:MAG: uroporphyrinogen decarboxylase family protein, partial [Chloroflexota bacterium]